eukprot:scaffold12490_cov66-Phaeocystis_antarctica.AAC.2
MRAHRRALLTRRAAAELEQQQPLGALRALGAHRLDAGRIVARLAVAQQPAVDYAKERANCHPRRRHGRLDAAVVGGGELAALGAEVSDLHPGGLARPGRLVAVEVHVVRDALPAGAHLEDLARVPSIIELDLHALADLVPRLRRRLQRGEDVGDACRVAQRAEDWAILVQHLKRAGAVRVDARPLALAEALLRLRAYL